MNTPLLVLSISLIAVFFGVLKLRKNARELREIEKWMKLGALMNAYNFGPDENKPALAKMIKLIADKP